MQNANPFSRIIVGSGMLRAEENADIAASKQFSGRLNVAMRGTASLFEISLEIRDTIRGPLLFLHRAALVGAAAATMGLGLVLAMIPKRGRRWEEFSNRSANAKLIFLQK